MNALILVDLQNDFVPGGALAVPDGRSVVPVANAVQPSFDLIVATQDWHPPDHGSFAANHPGHQPGDVIQLNGLDQILWPVHCVQHTPGAEFVAGLDRSRWSKIFPKGTDQLIDSYSGFFDNGHRRATGLGDFLLQRTVTHVFVMGLATDYCVKYTALDAVREGYAVTLIEDGCRGVELRPGDVQFALEELQQAGVRFVRSQELVG